MTTSDINGTLLRHLATGAGAASVLRQSCRKLVDLTNRFFNARTDIRRLAAAQDVAHEILSRNDFSDFVEIRDVVARQELRRQIKYGKQQDHTAHTVYLYLLGLWFYDNLPQVSQAVMTRFGASSAAECDDYFLLQWTFASLLHDIGYAFHTLDEDTQDDRRIIDGIYSWDWVKRHAGQLSAGEETILRNAFNDWDSKYGSSMRPSATYAAGVGSNVEILKGLATAPWVGDLVPSLKGKDIFSILSNDDSDLRSYADEVARTGYAGNGACVDHAVASGLLLFQYSTLWYWLMNHVRGNCSADVYHKISGGFAYDKGNIVSQIAPACRAVSFHNIQPNTERGRIIIPKLSIDKEPITCLAILCDELQRWDRYPAGKKHLDDYRLFSSSALESDDISLMCNGSRDNPRAVYVVRSWEAASTGSEKLQEFRETLVSRLPSYGNLAEVTIQDSGRS